MKKDWGLPLPPHRKLFFSEQVDQESIVKLTQSILDINEQDDYLEDIYKINGLEYTPPPIEIYIDSYGGLVYQVFGLIGVMETSRTLIHTYVTGAAMSAGFMILISGDHRYAYPHSTPLYHQVSAGMHGEAKHMVDQLRETKRLQKKMEGITLSKTNISKKKLKEIYKHKLDWYMTAKQALKYGVVDEIVEIPKLKS